MRRRGMARDQRREHAVDEARLAVEDVHRRVRHFAVHQQRQVARCHALEHRLDAADVGDAGVRMGGGAGRVELAAEDAGRWRARARSPPAPCVSVRYSVISGSKLEPGGSAARMRSR